MATKTVEMFYVGNFPDINTAGSVYEFEGAGNLLGQTFGSIADPLFPDASVQVTVNDADDGGVLQPGGTGGDEISYDLGSGAVTSPTGTVGFNYSVTLTYQDGSTATASLSFLQAQNGDIFHTGYGDGNDGIFDPSNPWEAKRIAAITFDAYDPGTVLTGNGHPSSGGHLMDNIVGQDVLLVCFARGTLIGTDRGAIAIEDLRVGDLVRSRDRGHQPIRWIGSRKLSAAALNANSNLRPVRIRAGALGENTPATDLLVSPQHRLLARSSIAQRMFGTNEVLAAAKQFLQLDGFDIAEDLEEVEYFHFLFDQHEIVYSNGAETESLYTGAEALKSVGPAAREEIFTIFPELRDRDLEEVPAAARELLTGRMARKLAVRHVLNGKPLVSAQS